MQEKWGGGGGGGGVEECQTEGGNVTRLTDGWGWGGNWLTLLLSDTITGFLTLCCGEPPGGSVAFV